MDEVDVNLIEAWERVWKRCERDPAEAAKRFRRVSAGLFARPPRAWCLALRASDTRLDDGTSWAGVPVEQFCEHEVFLESEFIRGLCKPVRIPWPGVKQCYAAAMLGKHRNALDRWLPVRAGRTRAERKRYQPRRWEEIRDPAWPLYVRYEPPGPHSHWGYDVPVVWSDRALDPGASNGSPPHPVWGSMWQYHFERLPLGFGQAVMRVPRVLPRRGKDVFAGWWWRCPGRLNAQKEPLGCGRLVQKLYAPLPVYGCGKFLGHNGGLKIATGSDEALKLAGE